MELLLGRLQKTWDRTDRTLTRDRSASYASVEMFVMVRALVTACRTNTQVTRRFFDALMAKMRSCDAAY
jgi:hypothetical protein